MAHKETCSNCRLEERIAGVYWLEQKLADVPADDNWLTTAERQRLASIGFAKRRGDWRLGRWTAKHAVAELFTLPNVSTVEILPNASGAPEVFCERDRLPVTVSISHRNGVCACALSRAEDIALGCDLEIVESRDTEFVETYFTGEEQRFICDLPEEDRAVAVTLVWSAKESVLKCLQLGLRADTRSVEIGVQELWLDRSPGKWQPFTAFYSDMRFNGLWHHEDGLTKTLAYQFASDARSGAFGIPRLLANG